MRGSFARLRAGDGFASRLPNRDLIIVAQIQKSRKINNYRGSEKNCGRPKLQKKLASRDANLILESMFKKSTLIEVRSLTVKDAFSCVILLFPLMQSHCIHLYQHTVTSKVIFDVTDLSLSLGGRFSEKKKTLVERHLYNHTQLQ